MGIIQGGVRERQAPPPVFSGYAGSLAGIAQVGFSYSSGAPIISGGTPPFSFGVVAGSLPAGTSLDPVTGVISGIPSGANGSSYNGNSISARVLLSDADGRTADFLQSIAVYSAPTLGFNPGIQTSFTGTSGVKGFDFTGSFQFVRINNSGIAAVAGTWFGPRIGYDFSSPSSFEVFASALAGVPTNPAIFNTWLNLGSSYLFTSSSSTFQVAIELRPVGGSTIGATIFTFS